MPAGLTPEGEGDLWEEVGAHKPDASCAGAVADSAYPEHSGDVTVDKSCVALVRHEVGLDKHRVSCLILVIPSSSHFYEVCCPKVV